MRLATGTIAVAAILSRHSASLPTGWDQADAVCFLEGAQGEEVSGGFAFREAVSGDVNSGLIVTYHLQGLTDGSHPFHVHRWGDVSTPQASAVGGHFVGTCSNCRPPDQPQEVGLLNNGTPITSVDGDVSGSFTDGVAKLRGDNTILGRSMIVHGESPNRSGERHGQCVIGLKQVRDGSNPPEPALDLGDAPGGGRAGEDDDTILPPPGSRASCALRPVSEGNTPVTGHIVLAERTSGSQLQDLSPNGTWVTYRGVGPLPGARTAHHVHAWGDVSAADGAAAGGHFLGNCSDIAPCRPPWASAQEVGMLFDNGLLNATQTAPGWGGQWAVGAGMAADMVVRVMAGGGGGAGALLGHGVLGRSVVVHAEPTGGAREGQCVIGVANPELYPAEDCEWGEWGEWGACDCPVGGGSGLAGVQVRERPVVVPPAFGGEQCPPLEEGRPCGPCPGSPVSVTGKVVAIAVGCLVTVGVVAGIVYYYRRRVAQQYQEDRSRLVEGEVVGR